jgi:hypothetical protein
VRVEVGGLAALLGDGNARRLVHREKARVREIAGCPSCRSFPRLRYARARGAEVVEHLGAHDFGVFIFGRDDAEPIGERLAFGKLVSR